MMGWSLGRWVLCVTIVLCGVTGRAQGEEPAELILHSGRVMTVDEGFTIAEGVAVRGGKIVAVGTTEQVRKLAGPKTEVISLEGRTVLPGLIDSHVHPVDASMTEFDHEIPDIRTIADVLEYIRGRAKVTPTGEWIAVRQIFITRLEEQRYPTRKELDQAAPDHAVAFMTGPDASLNSLALVKAKLTAGTKVPTGAKIEIDPETKEPSGIIRSHEKLLKLPASTMEVTTEQKAERLKLLLADYNRNGITGIIDRATSLEEQRVFQAVHAEGKLTCRVRLSRQINNQLPVGMILGEVEGVAADPLCRGDDFLQILGVKAFLDGGMLTGSAYMREPWGVSRIYGIDDPAYRGIRYLADETLAAVVKRCVERKLAFTAHSVGDGAVMALLNAYEEVNRSVPVAASRSTITHSNFMSREAIEACQRLSIPVDIQPIWLHLDGRTLVSHFGEERLTYFQPLRSLFEAGVVVGGGSDHMQKIGSLRAINPYHPFLGMWITLTRRARGLEGPLHMEQAISREQALRMYTANNAWLMKMEDRVGMIKPGYLADMIVVDRDPVTCPVDELPGAKVLRVWLGGKELVL